MSEPTILHKKTTIADLKPGGEFDDIFIIAGVKKRAKRNGEPFYVVTIADSTGQIEGNIWDNLDAFEKRGYTRDQYVRVAGSVGDYNGKINCAIKSMRPLDPAQVDPADFVPVSPRPVDEMVREFRELIAAVRDPELHALLELIFHPKGRLWRDFIVAPSARSVHQAYLHGLLEHTINVARNARALGACYHDKIDMDLLTTGALIHDMGKTVEYRWSPRIDSTDLGLMLGHITIGSNMLHEIAHNMPLAKGKLAQLHHMILSHHGRLEFGSPRLPCTAEAFVLHYADYADAQLAVYEEEAHAARERGESWSEWSKFIERRVFAGGGTFAAERLPGEYASDLQKLAGTFEIPPDKAEKD